MFYRHRIKCTSPFSVFASDFCETMFTILITSVLTNRLLVVMRVLTVAVEKRGTPTFVWRVGIKQQSVIQSVFYNVRSHETASVKLPEHLERQKIQIWNQDFCSFLNCKNPASYALGQKPTFILDLL